MEQFPPPKKGPGRPRQDGLPTAKKADSPTQPTPSPRFKRFWSEAPNGDQKPQKILNWVQEVPSWVRERLVMYVKRDWPVLVYIDREEKEKAKEAGDPVEHNYIDKLAGVQIFKSLMEIQDKYGAGDYSLTINDDMVEKRTLCEVWVREGWRDIRAFPPSDRRIDDVKNIDMTERANQPYIKYLAGKGKLPEQGLKADREADMAEATALSQMTGLVRDVVARQQQAPPPREDSSKGVDVVADAAKRGFEIIAQATSRAAEQGTKSEAPLDMLTKMVDVVDKLRPPQHSDNGMMGTFLTTMMEMNKTIMGIQNDRIAAAEARLKEREAATPPTTAPAGIESQLDTLLNVMTKLGVKIPGRAAADAAPASSSIMEVLPDILQGINGLVSTGVQAWQTKVYADAMARGQFVNAPPPPPPPPPPQQIQNRPGPGADVETEDAQEEDESANFLKFMGEIKRPLLNHINRNLGGAQFAEFLIDMYDEATYAQIHQQGADTLLMALNSYPPIAREIAGKDLVVKKFVEEFMNAEEILNAARDNEDDGEDEEPEGADVQPDKKITVTV